MKFGNRINRICQKALDYYSKGNCKQLSNDYQGAISDFTKAIKYKPNFAEAYYKRGNTKTLLNDNEGALSDYYKAFELNPKLAKTLTDKNLFN